MILRALILVAAIVLLAGCGKVGSLDVPPGSTYPKVYPSNAKPLPAASRNTVVQTGPQPEFTSSGAWIDPDQHRFLIDPFADINQTGSGGITGVQSNTNSGPQPNAGGVVQQPAVP